VTQSRRCRYGNRNRARSAARATRASPRGRRWSTRLRTARKARRHVTSAPSPRTDLGRAHGRYPALPGLARGAGGRRDTSRGSKTHGASLVTRRPRSHASLNDRGGAACRGARRLLAISAGFAIAQACQLSPLQSVLLLARWARRHRPDGDHTCDQHERGKHARSPAEARVRLPRGNRRRRCRSRTRLDRPRRRVPPST
jgi:hypothetical protein